MSFQIVECNIDQVNKIMHLNRISTINYSKFRTIESDSLHNYTVTSNYSSQHDQQKPFRLMDFKTNIFLSQFLEQVGYQDRCQRGCYIF